MRLPNILLMPVLALALVDCRSLGPSDDSWIMHGETTTPSDNVELARTGKGRTSPLPVPPLPPPSLSEQKSVASPPPPPSPAEPIKVGDAAFTVETVRCEGIAGVWATVLEGTVAEAEGDRIRLQLGQRLGLKYHPSEKGIDTADWYCVPRRKYCYAPIGFGDWGGRYQEGKSDWFARDQSFGKDIRLIVGIAPILKARCP